MYSSETSKCSNYGISNLISPGPVQCVLLHLSYTIVFLSEIERGIDGKVETFKAS